MKADESEARYQQAYDAVSRELAGETVVLTPEDGTVHVLDEVGSRVWQLCAESRSLGELCDSVTSEYDVERVTAERDIRRFLDEMLEIGVVRKL